MSKIKEFVEKIKTSEVKEEVKGKVKGEAKKEVKLEVKPTKQIYVARRPHSKTRERNELFKEFINSDEAKELIKNVKSTQKLRVLVNSFKEKYNEAMPLVSAYSIFNQIQK